MGKFTDLDSVQIQGKQFDQLSKFLLRNSGMVMEFMIKIKRLLNIISDTIKLDTINLFYVFGNKASDIRQYIPSKGLPRKGIIIRFLSFFFHLIKSIIYSPFLLKHRFEKEIIFFVCTNNQLMAVNNIIRFYNPQDFLKVQDHKINNNNFIYFWAFLSSLFFFPILIKNYFSASEYQKKTYSYAIDYYLLGYGIYFTTRIIYSYIGKPSMCVFSNDHTVLPRAFMFAARDEGITTLYVQHASISKKFPFPPLEFDYAFLEGYDALEKYNSFGFSKTSVFLTGMLKFNYLDSKINNSSKLNTLGVALNVLDDLSWYINLITQIKDKWPKINIILRPHPAFKDKSIFTRFCVQNLITYSDPINESSFEFLAKIDGLLVGDSNIILESIMLNIFPIVVTNGKYLDQYEFFENGLIDNIYTNIQDILNVIEMLIKHKPFIRNKAKMYSVTIDTKYDGKSDTLAYGLIEQIKNSKLDFSSWERIGSKFQLEAYQPKEL